MRQHIQNLLQDIVKEIFNLDVKIQLTVPEEQFGDLACNVAMQLARQVGRPPRDIAQMIADGLQNNQSIESCDVAGPGFLNITLTSESLWSVSDDFAGGGFSTSLREFTGKSYVVEYSCPNWFKELHTGHLYQTVVGSAIANMVEAAGANVHRTTFGGDVGLHVAKALWSIIKDKEGYSALKQAGSPMERAAFITKHYVKGTAAYEADEDAKSEIAQLNKNIYALNKNRDSHPEIADQYFTCRQWSTDYFHYFYDLVKVKDFEQYYPESTTEALGVSMVKKGLKDGVFEESDGAIIFDGEAHGLHKRVFLTRQNLPTYEAKDLGLITMEKQQFNFDHRILMTGSDQVQYMQVVWCALNQIDPSYEGTMTHLYNGIVKFADGSKMSSRLGNVAKATDVIDAVSEAIEGTSESDEKDKIVIGAIKYEFMKYSIGSDISFDINESVSIKGNSGPYMQYAYVRAKKISDSKTSGDDIMQGGALELDEYERRLARKLSQYRPELADATRDLSPNAVCLYLYELAQTFNQFYENDRVSGSGRPQRWQLVDRYLGVLKHGLDILGIETLRQM